MRCLICNVCEHYLYITHDILSGVCSYCGQAIRNSLHVQPQYPWQLSYCDMIKLHVLVVITSPWYTLTKKLITLWQVIHILPITIYNTLSVYLIWFSALFFHVVKKTDVHIDWWLCIAGTFYAIPWCAICQPFLVLVLGEIGSLFDTRRLGISWK